MGLALGPQCCCNTSIETCDDIRRCLGAVEIDGYWWIGVDMQISIEGVGDTDNCDYCTNFNTFHNICLSEGVMLDWWGPEPCGITGRRLKNLLPAFACGYGLFLEFGGITLAGIVIDLLASYTGATYRLDVTTDPTVLSRLCAHEIVTLPKTTEFDYLGEGYCTFPDSIDVRLVSPGVLDCEVYPPPPPEDCSGLEECETIPDAVLVLESLDTHDDPEVLYDAVPGFQVRYARKWNPSALNDAPFTLPYADGTWSFEKWLNDSEATGDYADPGTLVATDEYRLYASGVFDSILDYLVGEVYCYKIRVTYTCEEGNVWVSQVQFYFQVFFSNNYPVDPLAFDYTYSTSPGYSPPTSPDVVQYGKAYDCNATLSTCGFSYESLEVDGIGDGSRSYTTYGTFGAIA